MEKEAAKRPLPPAAHPPRSMAFKISNDSIMICRYPSATAPWDSAMDRGNLTDLFLQIELAFCARARVRNGSFASF